MAIGPSGWRTGSTDLLAELHNRIELALRILDKKINEEINKVTTKIEKIIKELHLEGEQEKALLDFKEKLVDALLAARVQAKERLEKLIMYVEDGTITFEKKSKTIHVKTANDVSLYISSKGTFRLPLNNISFYAYFPELFKMTPRELIELQAGWRAGDEGERGTPRMETVYIEQLLFWLATRFGDVNIEIRGINLNQGNITIVYFASALSWIEQWPKKNGKNIAKIIAKRLGLLTWYLSDGFTTKNQNVYISIENKHKYISKYMAKKIVTWCYKKGCHIILEGWDRWESIKNIKVHLPHPIHATIEQFTFRLYCTKTNTGICVFARTLLKSETELQRLKELLQKRGISITWQVWKKKYYLAQINGQSVLKLVEQLPEWCTAARKLLKKYKLQCTDEDEKIPCRMQRCRPAENPPLTCALGCFGARAKIF